jgi:hypothetical protein
MKVFHLNYVSVPSLKIQEYWLRNGFFLRSLYEEGTRHCLFRRKPEALGAGRICLSIFYNNFALGREPTHFRFDRNALPLHP